MADTRTRPKNGGARPGSGRKLGAATKKTREIADRIVAGGKTTPLEVKNTLMLAAFAEAGVTYDDKGTPKVANWEKGKLALEIATAAAPYVHPRLASIQGNPDAPLIIKEDGTLLDAARRLAFVLRAGVLQMHQPRVLEREPD